MNLLKQLYKQSRLIWIAAPTKVARELFFLVFCCIFLPPFVVFSLSYRIDRFDDVFKDCLYVFMSAFIWDHCILWSRKAKNSKNIVRYIDYVYLLFASLGILSAADSTVRHYKEELNVFVNQIEQDLAHFSEIYRPEIDLACSDKERISDCTILKALETKAQHGASTLKVSPLVFNMHLILSEMINEANKSPSVVSVLDSYEPNIYTDDAATTYLSYEPVGLGHNFYNRRQLGFLLIASAIALRIARVSAELGEWWSTTYAP